MTRLPSALTLALLDTAPPAEDPVFWRRDGGGEWRSPRARIPATTRRRFWCREARRDVEVEFLARGVPGLRSIVGVHRCPAFDPPEAVACSRPCTAASFRWPWEWPVPVRRRSSG